MSDFENPMGPEKGICINPKCRKTFKIPEGHQGRKPVLCPDCKEAGVKVKDLGLPEQKKAKKAARKPRKTAPVLGPPLRPAPKLAAEKQAVVVEAGQGYNLVAMIRAFSTNEEAQAYYKGFLDGAKAAVKQHEG